ncbi:hypothetical protein EYF80_064687 [Liparis tanakae]|uniref:Uncharacterized protein n=1 Tax=Liparis tanakae TaxID=230148 RepID=A0A4Z2E8U4_9TELE|nr:hypothetical protein EYF80_064687 [Liparis tanakae]
MHRPGGTGTNAAAQREVKGHSESDSTMTSSGSHCVATLTWKQTAREHSGITDQGQGSGEETKRRTLFLLGGGVDWELLTVWRVGVAACWDSAL